MWQARAKWLAATSNKQLGLQTCIQTNYRKHALQDNCLLCLPPRLCRPPICSNAFCLRKCWVSVIRPSVHSVVPPFCLPLASHAVRLKIKIIASSSEKSASDIFECLRPAKGHSTSGCCSCSCCRSQSVRSNGICIFYSKLNLLNAFFEHTEPSGESRRRWRWTSVNIFAGTSQQEMNVNRISKLFKCWNVVVRIPDRYSVPVKAVNYTFLVFKKFCKIFCFRSF